MMAGISTFRNLFMAGLLGLPGYLVFSQPGATSCELKYVKDLPTEPCNDYRLYAPFIPEHTPVKTIRLILHIVQQDPGLPARNFEDNETGRNWINAMTWQLNVIFRNLVPVSHPVAECPAAHIKDARIQFRVDSLFFHRSSRHWQQNPRNYSSDGDTWCNIWDDLVLEHPAISPALRDSAFHVFLVHSTWSEHHTGFSPGIGDLYANFVVVGGYYHHLFEVEQPDLNNAPYTAALTLGHEFAHACGLYHSENDDFCCDTQTGATNNMMHSKQASLTPCQLARMHYLLDSGPQGTASVPGASIWKTFATDYFSKDESYDIVIPTGQTVVWAAEKKLRTDVIVQSGAQLVIRCRTGLPGGSRIVVEKGGRLVLDGGVLTHNKTLWPGGYDDYWEGVLVHGKVRRFRPMNMPDTLVMPDPSKRGEVWLYNSTIECARKDITKRCFCTKKY